jgi:hypothetical protein
MAEPEPINDSNPEILQDPIEVNAASPDFSTPVNLEQLREAAAAAFPERDIDPMLVDDLYYDGRNVFMRGGDGVWRYEAASFATATLKERGFSEKVPKGASASPMDRVKSFIRTHRRVDGAGPALYHPRPIWEHGGKKFLNIATAKLWPAAPAAQAWGVLFPRYAKVLDNVFATQEYLHYLLAWLKRFYESAENGKPLLGQTMVLCGPVQCYKSFTIERLLTPAMGGYADLSSMAAGENNGFNAEVFSSPLAIVDDSKGLANETQRTRYSATIKKLAAHAKHTYHEKFLTPTVVEWAGRVVIATNDDPVSIQVIPQRDLSNEDKMIILAMKRWEGAPAPEEFIGLEQEELSHFLAWLKQWQIPSDIEDKKSRYGIKSFISPEIRELNDASSSGAQLLSVLDSWWKRRASELQKIPWEGTAVDLHQSLHDVFDNTSLTREWSVRNIGQQLAQLSNRPGTGITLVRKRSGPKKIHRYKIDPSV